MSDVELRIRRYQPADREAVRELHAAALRAVGALAGAGPWDDDLDEIERVYLDDGGEFLVGVLDGRVVAMGALRRTAPARAELKRMRVEPALQGRGFGGAMLLALEGRAVELGYETLHLDTSTRQDAARHLYERHRYREVGRTEWRGMEILLYEKTLPA